MAASWSHEDIPKSVRHNVSPPATSGTIRSSFSWTLFWFASLLLAVAVYSYPAFRTSEAIGSRQLPPLHAPDVSLYLNLSRLHSPSPGIITNPYYGVDVPARSASHLKFNFAFKLFSLAIALTHGQLWWSLFLWNALSIALLAGLLIFGLKRFLPDHSPEIVALGLALFVFFNFGDIKSILLTWLHPSWLGFGALNLPFIRPFFPQVAIPFLIAYLWLQIEWLRTKRTAPLAAMAFIQFVAFGMFPYTTLIMAGISAVSVVRALFFQARPPWLSVFVYSIGCGLADVAFYLHGSPNHAPAHSVSATLPLVRLDLSEFHHIVGGAFVLLALTTLLTAIAQGLPPDARWPLVGLGLSTLALMSGDVLFSETAFALTHHAGYFVHVALAFEAIFLFSSFYDQQRYRSRGLQTSVWGIALLLLLNGVITAHANYRAFLPFNRRVAALSKFLESQALASPPINSNDLLIAPADDSDDLCSWIPLVSPAKVLYCRSASVVLPESQFNAVGNETPNLDQPDQLQRFRQALYLYFKGTDKHRLDLLRESKTPSDQEKRLRLAYVGGIIPFNRAERRRGLEEVETELLPEVETVEEHNLEATTFFHRYPRIIVIDDPSHPLFDRTDLASYLTIEQQTASAEESILICTAK
jgi:hypothetical protein